MRWLFHVVEVEDLTWDPNGAWSACFTSSVRGSSTPRTAMTSSSARLYFPAE